MIEHIDDLIKYFEKMCKIVDLIKLNRVAEEPVMDYLYRSNFCRECITGQQQMVLIPCGHLICEVCKTTVCPFCKRENVYGVQITWTLLQRLYLKSKK